ncbi:hypothetical protein OIV83_000878 [Microbotryomycetes sp. JL201]|nr:hypothetical protein OIV83_000878 [Microbotryomycetes sp. JL201]
MAPVLSEQRIRRARVNAYEHHVHDKLTQRQQTRQDVQAKQERRQHLLVRRSSRLQHRQQHQTNAHTTAQDDSNDDDDDSEITGLQDSQSTVTTAPTTVSPQASSGSSFSNSPPLSNTDSTSSQRTHNNRTRMSAKGATKQASTEPSDKAKGKQRTATKPKSSPAKSAAATAASITDTNNTTTKDAEESNALAALGSLVSNLRATLTCNVCLEILDKPYSLACGHAFCRKCLAQWFHRPDPHADSQDEHEQLSGSEDDDDSQSGSDSGSEESHDDQSSESESESELEDEQEVSEDAPRISGFLGNQKFKVDGLTKSNADQVWKTGMDMFEKFTDAMFQQARNGDNARASTSTGLSNANSSPRRRIAVSAVTQSSTASRDENVRQARINRFVHNIRRDTGDSSRIIEVNPDTEQEEVSEKDEQEAEDEDFVPSAIAPVDTSATSSNESRPARTASQPASASARPYTAPTGEHRLRNLVCPQCRVKSDAEPPIKVFQLTEVTNVLQQAEKNGLSAILSSLLGSTGSDRGASAAPTSPNAKATQRAPGVDDADVTWGGLWKDPKDESADDRRKRRAAVVRDRDDGVRRCGECNWEIDEASGECQGCGRVWDLSDVGEPIGNESDVERTRSGGFMIGFNRGSTNAASHERGRRSNVFGYDSDRSIDDEDDVMSSDDAFIDDGPVEQDYKRRSRNKKRHERISTEDEDMTDSEDEQDGEETSGSASVDESNIITAGRTRRAAAASASPAKRIPKIQQISTDEDDDDFSDDSQEESDDVQIVERRKAEASSSSSSSPGLVVERSSARKKRERDSSAHTNKDNKRPGTNDKQALRRREKDDENDDSKRSTKRRKLMTDDEDSDHDDSRGRRSKARNGIPSATSIAKRSSVTRSNGTGKQADLGDETSESESGSTSEASATKDNKRSPRGKTASVASEPWSRVPSQKAATASASSTSKAKQYKKRVIKTSDDSDE